MKNLKILRLVLTIVAGVLVNRPSLASLYSFSAPDINGTYTSGASLSQVITDNSPVGAAYGFNFTATGLTISAVTLTVNMSGGFNGDMYGYLQHDGTLIQLFNPSSFTSGASGSTLNLTLSSASMTSLGGASAADLGNGNTYAAADGLSGFNTADPSGLWTLYFADQSPGDQMTLNSFNLSITAVPEPVNVALGIFGGVLVVWGVGRRLKAGPAAITN